MSILTQGRWLHPLFKQHLATNTLVAPTTDAETIKFSQWATQADIFIRTLDTQGPLARMDVLHLFYSNSDAHSRTNIIDPSYGMLSKISAPTFQQYYCWSQTSDAGYLSNSSLDYQPMTAGSGKKFALNDHSFGCAHLANRIDGVAAAAVMRVQTCRLHGRRSTNNFETLSGTATVATIANSTGQTAGVYGVVRTSSADYLRYKHGVLFGSAVPSDTTGQSTGSISMRLFANNSAVTMSDMPVGMQWYGSSMTAAQMAIIQNAWKVFSINMGVLQ